jgi:DNA polymerase
MTNLRRIVRQRLESLQRAGVQQLGRPVFEAPVRADSESIESATTPIVSASTDQPSTLTAESPQSAKVKIPLMSDISSPESLSLDQRKSELTRLCHSVTACTKCAELVENRTQTVFGVGNPEARLLFFGEAPGADEDRQGEPFVGRAGQLLTKIIEACTLTRDDVYIMNVLKCRPPQNRNPSPEESLNCRPFFERQMEIIRPEYICCLGSIAATTLLETKQSIGKMRGQLHDWRWAKVLVTYHPAYLLRNPSAKREVWNDMQFLMREMGIELPT